MPGTGYKKTPWERFMAFLRSTLWWTQGQHLKLQLEDDSAPVRSEAEEALAKVIFETDIDPDCVSATIVRGGPTIQVKHDRAWEAFIHKSYMEAADKAIEWIILQGDEIQTTDTGKKLREERGRGLNRAQRRRFDKQRKRRRGGRKPGQPVH